MNAALLQSKPTKLAALIGVIFCAGWIGYRIGAPEINRAHVNAATDSAAPAVNHVSASASVVLRDRLLRAPKEEPPFWLSAVVPEPAKPRLPTPAIVPVSTGAGITPAEVASRVSELEATPSSPDNAARLNAQIVLWFSLAPDQATEWLNQTARFDELGSSLSSIAENITSSGHADTGLVWAESIPDEATRRATRMLLYAHQVRQNKVTDSELQQLGFDAQEIAQIRSGSLVD
jgi:hypothetical protein